MDNRLPSDESQPKKNQAALWAVAGFLVLVLAVYHLRGGEEDKAEGPAEYKTPPPPRSTSQRGTPDIKADQPAINWPEISFDELVEHDPFRPEKNLEEMILGTPADQAARQTVEQALEESREDRLQQESLARELSSPDRQVRLLFQSPSGAAAMIGDRVVHVGDKLDSYQVLEIDRAGVVLKRLDEPDAASSGSD